MVVRLHKKVLFRDAPQPQADQQQITAFYHFAELTVQEQLQLMQDLERCAAAHNGRGLILLAPDGWNGTVAGSNAFIEALKSFAKSFDKLAATEFKDSVAPRNPFRQFKIEQRGTIIDMGSDQVPDSSKARHLSPAEWDEMLQRSDVTVLDVRNEYEWRIGTFRGAITPRIDKFNQFPEFVAQAALPKDKPVLMFCTGGVRCEKASTLMTESGFSQVYQLDGGILRYLKEKPHGNFLGECFVFDNRVAVDQALHPSERYRFCPHCGNAGDRHVECRECHRGAIVCEECSSQPERQSCSKNCAYHLRRRSADSEEHTPGQGK